MVATVAAPYRQVKETGLQQHVSARFRSLPQTGPPQPGRRGQFLIELARRTGYLSGVRRLSFYLLAICCLSTVLVAQGATGKVIKVLPLFLDQQGKDSASPSLYERDAYQVYLRDHPEKRSGLQFAVQWKAKGPTWETLKIRVEVKGIAEGSLPKEKTLEKVVTPGGRFSHWTKLFLTGEDYKELVGVTAWRATLWEGDKLLGEEKSFLW